MKNQRKILMIIGILIAIVALYRMMGGRGTERYEDEDPQVSISEEELAAFLEENDDEDEMPMEEDDE